MFIILDILKLFVTWYIYFKGLVNQQFCKRQHLPLHWTLSIVNLQMLLMLKQQHYTLTKVKKSEIITNDPFKYPWDFKINI